MQNQETNKNAVICPWCGSHELDCDPFEGEYFSEDMESVECDKCHNWFCYGAKELKRFAPPQCSQYDPEKKQCKWEIEGLEHHEYDCDHSSSCCPTYSDFIAWIDDYEIVTEKEEE